MHCLICGHINCKKLPMHFYEWYQCDHCDHCYNNFNEIALKKYRNKFLSTIRKENNHFIQNSVTDQYRTYMQFSNASKLSLCDSLLDKSSKILDCNSEDGYFINLIKDKVDLALGLNQDECFKYVSGDNSIIIPDFDMFKTNNKFNIILMIDFLENRYSVYETFVHACSLLTKDGVILVQVPINNNPVKNYQARCHEFSEASIHIFAKKTKANFNIKYKDNFAELIFRPFYIS